MLWIICIVTYVIVVLVCDQWDRHSTRRWVDSRAKRRAEYRAWCEAQHVKAMERWHAEAIATARWNAFCARVPWAGALLPWAVAVLIFLALVALAASRS